MHWLIDFIVRNHKPLASIGFICGLAPWILKLINKMLPEQYKRAFEVWVNEIVPPLSLWKPDDLYEWANDRGYAITIWTCILTCAVWALAFIRLSIYFHVKAPLWHAIAVFSMGAVVFSAFISDFLWWIIGYSSLESAVVDVRSVIDLKRWRRLLIVACILACGAPIMDALGYRDYLEKGLFILLCLFALIGVPLFVGVLFIYSVTFLRLPAKWLLRMVQWLAYHPKGAWAALLLALTSALDLLRVIFR